MKEKIRIREVLDRWELDNPRPETQLHEETPRQIFTIRTDSGRYVLKGIRMISLKAPCRAISGHTCSWETKKALPRGFIPPGQGNTISARRDTGFS